MSFLTKKIFTFSKNPIGLDLSDLSVKVVQLENNEHKIKIRSFGEAPMPTGIVANGEILKKEGVKLAIEKALEKAGPAKMRTKEVICSLPETKAFLRIISLPKMKREEVTEAIKWEMEANIPLAIDQVYFDWQILENNPSRDPEKMDILVVAVSQKSINEILDTMEMAGLQVVGLEIESIAQARSLIKNDDKETNLIIDLGDRRTSFLILFGNVPCFTSSVPLSGGSLTDSISKAMSVPLREAEDIKIKYGIGSFTQKDVLFKAVEPVLENLASEIDKSIDFYINSLRYSETINKIIICGGGANTKGIIPYLSEKLNKEVELGNPWINFSLNGDLPLISRRASVQYSTAIGLALKGCYAAEMK